MKCISTVSYAVNNNRRRRNIFQPTKGLRQGDPLSPFLFLICCEGLSSLMRLAMREGLRGPEISHLLFVDDYILFDEATNRARTQQRGKKDISTLLGVRSSTNLEKYLGLPNIVGRRMKKSFQNLKYICELKNGVQGYYHKGAIPTYAMSCFLLPESLCGELENIFAKFWLQKRPWEKKRNTLVPMKEYMLFKRRGGNGFQKGWGIINNPNSLVVRMLKAKFSKFVIGKYKFLYMEKYLGDEGCFGERTLLKGGYGYECFS
ncbi:reverse transcriptase [Gossypium australe]|uniref:Reverse transcriptase n=1 Tax=Gossypium australe TaxID=47621 RepID=A0A5B6WGG5_9ROSI|nr:reverse transcriptase [Gossypium australe]